MRRVLIIDDELAAPASGDAFLAAYALEGFEFEFAGSDQEAFRLLQRRAQFSAILLDIRFEGYGDRHGLAILDALRRRWPALPVVMMSSRKEPDILVRSWDLGARSYVVKWGENPRFREELRQRLEQFALRPAVDPILGNSPGIQELRRLIAVVAEYDTTILIEGETGTGKELVAESLHRKGTRSRRPLVSVNCAAIPPTLLASELFGHKRGSFTGAVTDARGKIEAAAGGVLFLDEIGELPREVQAGLLRFLDRREISRVGEETTRVVDVQVFAATNRHLTAEVEAGHFRLDLLQRLNQFRIRTPPLRECRSDIPEIAESFLVAVRERKPKPVNAFSRSALETMLAYDWPGNVRELRNAVDRAYVLTPSGEIDVTVLPEEVRIPRSSRGQDSGSLAERLARYAWIAIRQEWEADQQPERGRRKRVAQKLGLHPVNGFTRKLDEIKRDCPALAAEIELIVRHDAATHELSNKA